MAGGNGKKPKGRAVRPGAAVPPERRLAGAVARAVPKAGGSGGGKKGGGGKGTRNGRGGGGGGMNDEQRARIRKAMAASLARQLAAYVTNASSLRREALDGGRGGGDGARDIAEECHYATSLTPQFYKRLYDTDPIAARIVEVEPKESQQVEPEVWEDDDPKVQTVWEARFQEVGRRLGGEGGFGWRRQDKGNPIWEYVLRADIASGIGHYGIILLGLDDLREGDGRTLASAVDAVVDIAYRQEGTELQFLRVFPESLAPVAQWDADPTSPRYGKPVQYRVTFNDPEEMPYSGIGAGMVTHLVHWTRVIHIADNLTSSEVVGRPRLRQLAERVQDLQKVYASAGEAFWQSCFAVTVVETHPEMGDAEIPEDDLREMFEDIRQGLQRELMLAGMTAKTLPPATTDPTPYLAAFIEAVAMRMGMPIRILKGSERGELASSQDDVAWNDRMKLRQNRHVTPRIVDPLVNRLIQVGVLPVPELGWKCEWPDLTSKSDKERAETGLIETQAMSAFVAGGLDEVFDPKAWGMEVMGWSEERADALLAKWSDREETEGAGDGAAADEAGSGDGEPGGEGASGPDEGTVEGSGAGDGTGAAPEGGA